LKSVPRGIAACTVSTFCPARGPKAMRQVHAAAGNGLSTPASSESALSSEAKPILPTGERFERQRALQSADSR
jgi:hypothetical protein